jgi:hypothetical protein
LITPDEIAPKLDTYVAKRKQLHARIVKAARPLIPVLKDAGRTHSAAELDELFFELDALEQETVQIVGDNLGAALEALRQRIRGR